MALGTAMMACTLAQVSGDASSAIVQEKRHHCSVHLPAISRIAQARSRARTLLSRTHMQDAHLAEVECLKQAARACVADDEVCLLHQLLQGGYEVKPPHLHSATDHMSDGSAHGRQ